MGAREAILLGGGGHGRVVRALAEALGIRVIGVCDPTVAGAEWFGLPVLGDDAALERYPPGAVLLLMVVGRRGIMYCFHRWHGPRMHRLS